MAWPNNWNPRDLISAARLNQWAAALRALDSEPQRYTGQATAANVSIAHNTWTAISFTTEVIDAGNTFAPPNTRITMGAAGRGWALARVTFAENATGTRGVRFKQDGSALYTYRGRATSTGGVSLNVVIPVQFGAGSYFEVEAFQDSGAALTVSSAALTVIRMWG